MRERSPGPGFLTWLAVDPPRTNVALREDDGWIVTQETATELGDLLDEYVATLDQGAADAP